MELEEARSRTSGEQPQSTHFQRDFSTEEGRMSLYRTWVHQRIADGLLEEGKMYTLDERCAFFADWLCSLIGEGKLNPRTRLPPYEQLALLPFHLEKQDIALVIRQLRQQKVLPSRKKRKDAGTILWTPRDEVVLRFIGEMRAVRFDQMQQLLSRESPGRIEKLLSLSRTCRIIDRYEREKVVVYRRIYYQEPGWIFLTRKGLRQMGMDFRAEAPSNRLMEHLYWINEVRLHLEEIYPHMQWISERSLQAQQEQRVRGRRLIHIPDAILVLPHPDGTDEQIDIEVQVSKPSPREVEDVMGSLWTSGRSNTLWYYVNRASRGVVWAVYEQMRRDRRLIRDALSIIDLEEWRNATE